MLDTRKGIVCYFDVIERRYYYAEEGSNYDEYMRYESFRLVRQY